MPISIRIEYSEWYAYTVSSHRRLFHIEAAPWMFGFRITVGIDVSAFTGVNDYLGCICSNAFGELILISLKELASRE